MCYFTLKLIKMNMQNIKSNSTQLNLSNVENQKYIKNKNIFFLIDNIRSAQNIGSIFRTADAFGVQKIVLTGISAVPPNKEILKTALGATNTVKWEYNASACNSVKYFKTNGYKIYAIEQTQNSIKLQHYKIQNNESIVLVFGNEVDGVNQDVIDLCDGTLEIPQFGSKHSLNVAVAAGIVTWHLVNQHLNI